MAVYAHIHCLNMFKLIHIYSIYIHINAHTQLYIWINTYIYTQYLLHIYVHIHLYLHIYTFVRTNMHTYTVFHINANIHIHTLYNKVAYTVVTMNPFMIYKMNLA